MVSVSLGRRAFVEALVAFPSKHYHEEPDEWFYCLGGEYVVEIGDQRFRLGLGIEQFFRDLEKRGEYFGNSSPEDKGLPATAIGRARCARGTRSGQPEIRRRTGSVCRDRRRRQ